MVSANRAVYTFCVRSGEATQVYLAIGLGAEPVSIVPMARVGPDVWRVSLPVPHGEWSFCYYVENDVPGGRQVVYCEGCGGAPLGILSGERCCVCPAMPGSEAPAGLARAAPRGLVPGEPGRPAL
jgi:hypothetical protein